MSPTVCVCVSRLSHLSLGGLTADPLHGDDDALRRLEECGPVGAQATQKGHALRQVELGEQLARVAGPAARREDAAAAVQLVQEDLCIHSHILIMCIIYRLVWSDSDRTSLSEWS